MGLPWEGVSDYSPHYGRALGARSMQFHWFLVLLALTVPSVVGQSMDTRRLAQEVLPAVVEIRIVGDSGGSSGSGFIVYPEGKIVTSLHVIAGATTGSVRLATGEVYDSFAVLSFDLRRDLAIIQIPGFDLPVVKLGNSNDAQPGDRLLSLVVPKDYREA